jgi:Uma2 family endonuclease
MSTATQLMTADDLFRLPDDGMRHELVKGLLHTMPPAGFEHGAVGIKLTLPLGAHVKTHGLGIVVAAETGFIVTTNPDTVRAPDIGFVRNDRVQATGITKKYFPGAPDLAVEVVSPGDTVYEVDDKVQEWLGAGAGLVWVVNPRRRTVTVHRPTGAPIVLTVNDVLDGEQVVPGFSIRVAELFV